MFPMTWGSSVVISTDTPLFTIIKIKFSFNLALQSRRVKLRIESCQKITNGDDFTLMWHRLPIDEILYCLPMIPYV